VERRDMAVPPPALAPETLGFFRWGRIGEQIVVTNDAGDWALLDAAEFADLAAGRVGEGHPRFAELRDKGMLRDGLDLDALAARMAKRKRSIRRGAYLHVVTLSSRPAHRAGGNAPDAAPEMDTGTAEQIVNFALQSGSPSLVFEFCGDGGEPLWNWPVLQHFVEYARARNKQAAGKTLSFRVLTNFAAMSDEIAAWLVDHEIRVVTSLDGPAPLHDAHRHWKPGSPHAEVVRWIGTLNGLYAAAKRPMPGPCVEAIPTLTRESLSAARAIIDEYVRRGLRTIRLQPLTAAGVDAATWARIGYGAEEFLVFYREALAYIVELNRRGVAISERLAAAIATKILTGDDPEMVDVQSPTGEGTNALAYGTDGHVYPTEEARRFVDAADALFDLGHVAELSASDVQQHPTVRAIAAASLLDSHPMCADCWNNPFCGFSPVRNFVTQGDLFGQRPHCLQCKQHLAISTRIFELLSNGDAPEGSNPIAQWTDPGLRVGGDRSLKSAP
jgi:uncharacterized protein